MPQAAGHHPGDVVVGDFAAVFKCRQSPRRPVGDDVTAQAVHIELAAHRRDSDAQVGVDLHLAQALLGRHHPLLQGVLAGLHRGVEAIGIVVKGGALIHHLHPQLRIAHGAHLHAHAEAIE